MEPDNDKVKPVVGNRGRGKSKMARWAANVLPKLREYHPPQVQAGLCPRAPSRAVFASHGPLRLVSMAWHPRQPSEPRTSTSSRTQGPPFAIALLA